MTKRASSLNSERMEHGAIRISETENPSTGPIQDHSPYNFQTTMLTSSACAEVFLPLLGLELG